MRSLRADFLAMCRRLRLMHWRGVIVAGYGVWIPPRDMPNLVPANDTTLVIPEVNSFPPLT